MICRKCKAELPDVAKFCLMCGVKQTLPKQKPRKHGNGIGTVYKRGKTWVAEVTVGWEEKKRIPARKGGFRTSAEAWAYIPTLKTSQSKSTQTVASTIADAITFKQLYDRWLPHYAPRVKSMGSHKAAVKYYEKIFEMPFAEMSTEDMQQCIDDCPKMRRTKEDMKSLAMLMYKYAATLKLIDHNYAQYIYCGKDDGSRRPGFSEEQIELIRKAIGKSNNYPEYTYCLIYTGFRPNEMLSMKKDAYDEKSNTLTGGFKTEAGTNRIVTLSPKISDIVKSLAANADPYIFPREKRKLLDDKFFREDLFYPLLAELGIQDIPSKDKPAIFVPYSCRHTFADLMKNVQGSDTDKAALMGHADASMTKYYQSADITSLKAITDRI